MEGQRPLTLEEEATLYEQASSFYENPEREIEAELENAFASLEEEYEFEKEGEYEVENIIFKKTHADIERIGGTFEGGGGGTLPPEFALKTFTKEERIASVFFHVVDSHKYFNMDEEKKQRFIRHLQTNVQSLQGIMHMNVVTLALASLLLWDNKEKDPTKLEVKKFLSDKPKIAAVDFIRYLRFLHKYSR